jgi:hypothetical protein
VLGNEVEYEYEYEYEYGMDLEVPQCGGNRS